MHIVIPDDYQNAIRNLNCFAKLSGHKVTIYQDTPDNLDDLVMRLSTADVVVLIRERTSITEELLARLPNLKLISQTGKVSGHIDLQACTRHGIAVAEGVGSPVAPAELCWALIMSARRHIKSYSNELSAGNWQSSHKLGLGRVLKGLTLGIWGYGKIGRLVAGYGRAFGMRVLVWGRAASLAASQTDGYDVATDKAELFTQSDVLSLHLRLNDETRGCVAHEDLVTMKPDALFVNTSRAELVEPGALESALQKGRPGFAAIDVYESEPILNADHPLLKMENVLCTPHIGYVEKESYELYFGAAFDNVLAFADGNPQNLANPQAITKE